MPYNFAVGNELFPSDTVQRNRKTHSIYSCLKMQTQMSYSVDNANCRRQLNYGVVLMPIILSSKEMMILYNRQLYIFGFGVFCAVVENNSGFSLSIASEHVCNFNFFFCILNIFLVCLINNEATNITMRDIRVIYPSFHFAIFPAEKNALKHSQMFHI